MNEKSNNLSSYAQSLVTSKRVFSILQMIGIVFITGLIQFATLNFSVEALKDPNFYSRILYRAILVVLAYSTAHDIMFDKCLANPVLIESKEKYKNLLKLKSDNFDEFIDKVNFRRKSDVYKKDIEKKIFKIEKKLIKVLPDNKRESLKKELDHYNSIITSDYIEKNLHLIDIKFKAVYSSDFLGSELEDGVDNLKTRSDYGKVKTVFTLRKLAPFIVFSIIAGFTLRDILWNGFTLSLFINLLLDFSMIVMRFRQGISDSQRAVDEAYLVPIVNKNNLLKEYIDTFPLEKNSNANKIISFIEAQERNS